MFETVNADLIADLMVKASATKEEERILITRSKEAREHENISIEQA